MKPSKTHSYQHRLEGRRKKSNLCIHQLSKKVESPALRQKSVKRVTAWPTTHPCTVRARGLSQPSHSTPEKVNLKQTQQTSLSLCLPSSPPLLATTCVLPCHVTLLDQHYSFNLCGPGHCNSVASNPYVTDWIACSSSLKEGYRINKHRQLVCNK